MKEKIIKFIIIALVALFSARMACADSIQQVKYPYVERVEIGYKPQPFEIDSIAKTQTIKIKKEEKTNNKKISGLDILISFLAVVGICLLCFGFMYFIISFFGVIAILLVKFFHKKR